MRRLLAVALLVALAGCGDGPRAAPATVTAALTRVDRYVAAHDYAHARLALDDLVRRTAAARAAGALDEARAQRITAAAAELAAALPVAAPRPTATATPKPAPAHHERKRHKRHEKGDEGD
jgi:hypothetical protein